MASRRANSPRNQAEVAKIYQMHQPAQFQAPQRKVSTEEVLRADNIRYQKKIDKLTKEIEDLTEKNGGIDGMQMEIDQHRKYRCEEEVRDLLTQEINGRTTCCNGLFQGLLELQYQATREALRISLPKLIKPTNILDIPSAALRHPFSEIGLKFFSPVSDDSPITEQVLPYKDVLKIENMSKWKSHEHRIVRALLKLTIPNRTSHINYSTIVRMVASEAETTPGKTYQSMIVVLRTSPQRGESVIGLSLR